MIRETIRNGDPTEDLESDFILAKSNCFGGQFSNDSTR
jgi:hypothetical protein